MKYLLNHDFKVIRKGTHVEADESVGEMIFNTEEVSDFTIGMMEEVANSNKLGKLGSGNKSSIIENLTKALETMTEVAEQNGPTESQIAERIITEGFDAGDSDDEMLVKMVTEGISFKNAMKIFKQTVERLGLRVSTKDVKETVAKLLAELDFNPETYDEVQDILGHIREQTQAEEKQANAAIRAYCKANEIALPKKPKVVRMSTKTKIYNWIVSNPNCDETELAAFITGLGKDGDKQAARLMPIVNLCHQFAQANAALFAEGEEVAA